MAKGLQGHSRQSSAIRLVQEDSTPKILNPDLAPDQTHQLVERFLPQKSPAAMHHLKEASRSRLPGERGTLSMVNPAAVLKELFELLEDYAPVWYTEENHNRIVAALAQSLR